MALYPGATLVHDQVRLQGAGDGGGGTTSETRFIGHKYGETEVSGVPGRVVTVGFTDQDYVLALGVKPVAVREWYGEYDYATWPWARDELGDAEPEILPPTELNFEQIAGLEPDLIVGVSSGMTREEYDTLSEIAPTPPSPASLWTSASPGRSRRAR